MRAHTFIHAFDGVGGLMSLDGVFVNLSTSLDPLNSLYQRQGWGYVYSPSAIETLWAICNASDIDGHPETLVMSTVYPQQRVLVPRIR
jgi:hypothetical protein